jgi:hypothetical protein
MPYIYAIDPGISTGVVLGHYDETVPYEVIGMWQFSGGLAGLMDFAYDHWSGFYGDWEVPNTYAGDSYEFICERFVPLSGGGFSQTAKSVEPLRIEGALVAMGLLPADTSDPHWQRASCQVLAGGDTPAARKRNSGNILKRGGLWVTGKMFFTPDADDVISALKHSLWFLRNTVGHTPTIEKYWKEEHDVSAH